MFGRLFGSNKSTDSVIDGVKRGLDALVFTDEEKSVANAKGMELFIKYQEATQPQNVARRLLAVMLVGEFCLLVMLAVMVWPWLPDYSKYILQMLENVLMVPVGLVIGFYFVKRLNLKSGS